MAILTKIFRHRIIAYVLLLLIIFQFLPCVTCQQEPESASSSMIILTILIGMFFSVMLFCCLFYVSYIVAIAAEGREVLHTMVAEGREVLHGRARNGLDKDIIESFPIFLYSEVKGLKIGKGGVECTICLNKFEDEETLRWMNPCSHTFHANCIDVWLSFQSTCPVCRSHLSLQPGESFPCPSMDLETGNARIGTLESADDIRLNGNSVTWNNNANYTTPRSRSTGLLSSWRMAELLVPRSHSAGHSLVQLGDNLDRYTLELPEDVQRQLVSLNMVRRGHMVLPRVRSLIQGYRSASVGSEISGFSQGRETLRRAISMSLSFPLQAASVRSTFGKDDLVQETSQAKDKDSCERSFERLMPEKGLIYISFFFSSTNEDKSQKWFCFIIMVLVSHVCHSFGSIFNLKSVNIVSENGSLLISKVSFAIGGFI